jgi:uncharacterized protein DUF2505
MKVSIDDIFEIECAKYVALYFDEPFNEHVGQSLHMGRKLLRLERSNTRIVRHVCYEPAQDPEVPTQQAFGSSKAGFVEELDYDVASRRGTWRTIPSMWAERVRNEGTIEFADVPGGTRRSVRGEVKVKLFGFGGIVERMIVREIEKSYVATTRITREWLAKR